MGTDDFRSMSQPSALSGPLLLESWCLHIQGPGPEPGESSISEDRDGEDAHMLCPAGPSAPAGALETGGSSSLLSLTDLIPFHLLGCYLISLSPALCYPWGAFQPDHPLVSL